MKRRLKYIYIYILTGNLHVNSIILYFVGVKDHFSPKFFGLIIMQSCRPLAAVGESRMGRQRRNSLARSFQGLAQPDTYDRYAS